MRFWFFEFSWLVSSCIRCSEHSWYFRDMPALLREWVRHVLLGSLSAPLVRSSTSPTARVLLTAQVQLAGLLLTQVFFSPGPQQALRFSCDGEFMGIVKLLISRKATSVWEFPEIWVKGEFCQLKGKQIWEKEMLKENIVYSLRTISWTTSYALTYVELNACEWWELEHPRGSEAQRGEGTGCDGWAVSWLGSLCLASPAREEWRKGQARETCGEIWTLTDVFMSTFIGAVTVAMNLFFLYHLGWG